MIDYDQKRRKGHRNPKFQNPSYSMVNMSYDVLHIFKLRMSVTLAQIPKSHTALGFMITSNMHTRKQ